MKRSPFKLGLNIIFVLTLFIAVIPSIHVNLFGKNIAFDGIDLTNVCLKTETNLIPGEEEGEMIEEVVKSLCFPQFNFENTRAFEKQTILHFEFTALNELEDMSSEDKQEIYEKNVEIFKQRIGLLELPDYSFQEGQTDSGGYFIEISVPDDVDGYYAGVLTSISVYGEFSIYEDIPGFQPEEELEEVTFSFLQGKKVSEYISLDDIQRISNPYFDPTLRNGQGGFVIKADFGSDNMDKVMKSAEGTASTGNKIFPGILIVHDEIPVGVQAVYIPPVQLGYDGQSYVIFSVLGDTINQLRVKALYSMISTGSMDTSLELTDTYEAEGVFAKSEIEYIKLALALGLVLMILIPTILRKKQGMLWSTSIGIVLLFGFGFSQLGVYSVQLSEGIIFGAIMGAIFAGFILSPILNFTTKTFVSEFEILKKRFWLVMPALLLSAVIAAIAIDSNQILSVVFGLLIFIIATLYVVEGWIKSVYPYIFNKTK